MTDGITFETATLADVLKKAEICAPKARGSDHAWGTAAGLVMEYWPGAAGGVVQVRSTNLEVFYTERVDYVDGPAEPVSWRIPAQVVTGIVSSLPIGTGRTVTLRQVDRMLEMTSGRTTGRVGLMPWDNYPMWDPYTEEESAVVSQMGRALAQVEWACARDGEPLTGVYLDGQHMVATDRYRAARVPCEVPILQGRAVTVPVKLLTPILRHAGDVRVGISGNFLTISPDAHTQIKCIAFDKNIPDPKAFAALQYDSSILVSRDQLVEMVNRMMNVAKGSTDEPRVTMLLGGGQLTLRVPGAHPGEFVQDSIELPGQCEHGPLMLRFLPKNINDAVGRAPDEKVQLHYNAPGGAANTIVHVNGGGDYRTWFVQVRASGSREAA